MRKPLPEDFGLTTADIEATEEREKRGSNVFLVVFIVILVVAAAQFGASGFWGVIFLLAASPFIVLFFCILRGKSPETDPSDKSLRQRVWDYKHALDRYQSEQKEEKRREELHRSTIQRIMEQAQITQQEAEVVNALREGGYDPALYQQYLKTRHWKEVRRRALRRAGNRCQICGSSTGLQVHHNSYHSLGCEKPKDLIVLCDKHHSMAHKS